MTGDGTGERADASREDDERADAGAAGPELPRNPGRLASDLAAAAAASDTVGPTDLLATVEDGGSLYEAPPLAYLGADEQPHVRLFSPIKGYGVDTKHRTEKPEGPGHGEFYLTDRRVLLLLGREGGDHVAEIPCEEIAGAEYSVGRLKNRLTVRADATYHLWAHQETVEETLRDAVAFLEAGCDPDAIR